MHFDVVTGHPQMCLSPLNSSILGRAQKNGVFSARVHDLRESGIGRHRMIDDAPYGGGSGMVLRVDVIDAALKKIKSPQSTTILLDPTGERFEHSHAVELSSQTHLIFVCGHYEGVDARVREHLVDRVFSAGDFVLTGGEIPALMMIDAIVRQIPGVLGNPDSLNVESFSEGLLEAPTFTRPQAYLGWEVPDVLLSGHHQKIQDWRRQQSIELTKKRRPDLILGHAMDTKSSD